MTQCSQRDSPLKEARGSSFLQADAPIGLFLEDICGVYFQQMCSNALIVVGVMEERHGRREIAKKYVCKAKG